MHKLVNYAIICYIKYLTKEILAIPLLTIAELVNFVGF